MKLTLYEQVKNLEHNCEWAKYSIIPKNIDLPLMIKDLFHNYENNPIFHDAAAGKQSIEKSLEEISQINTGINRYLPWKKNKEHNERIEYIAELITKPNNLKTYGILAPDNLITAATEWSIAVFSIFYAISRYSSIIDPNLSPEDYQTAMSLIQVAAPSAVAVLSAPLVGALMNSHRLTELPIAEAKYLDQKILELYKN